MTSNTCSHTNQIKVTDSSATTCQECVTDGTKPVALRVCLSCGHVGCCDSSIGLHARKHFEQSSHPIIQSLEPAGTEPWRYCYIDKTYL